MDFNAIAGELVHAPGTQIEDYEILEFLGAGGFGFTYRARDHRLGGEVALKEYLPLSFATRRRDGWVGPRSRSQAEIFTWGLEQVLEEARNLRRVKHPNVVRVVRHFEALGTAFIVMELVPGRTLAEVVADTGPWSEARYRPVFDALLSACRAVHAEGLLHRDIKPSNIILQPDDTPVLIDFGAARQVIGSRTLTLTALITPGYAPIEQYAQKGVFGPYTDIYALAATSYYVLSGSEPEDAVARVPIDALQPLEAAAKERGSQTFLRAVDLGLKVAPKDRPQTVEAWIAKLPKTPDAPEATQTRPKLPSWLLGGLALAAICGVALLVRPDPNAKAEAALAQITPHDWSVKPGADLMAAALKSAGVDDYRRLAETGDAKAETLMGLIYHVGSTSVKQDQVEATSWLSRAADQQNARALYDLGDVYVSTGGANPERYAEYFRRSADLGNARAEDSLADAYLAGTGVPKDASLAAHWLEQAADQGLTSAEAKLGRLYYNGDLVLRNYDRAATLLQKAANENDPDAEHDLALAYYAGNGVPQNKYEALVLFTKSANQGNVDAEFQLGKMYAEGDGVIADVASGRALITKAANSSSIAAKAWLAAHPLFPSLATPPPLGSLTW